MTDRAAGETAIIKVPEATKSRVKLGAAVLGMTMQEFVEKAVTDFFVDGIDMVEANRDAIIAGESIPFPLEVYTEEIRRRRAA